jgi:hypothetical protein
MDVLPAEFPPLPEHFDNDNWSPNVIQAHSILFDAYSHAFQALNAGDSDAHRLRIHSDRLLNRMLPILEAMEPEVLNPEWVKHGAEALAGLVLELEGSSIAINQM